MSKYTKRPKFSLVELLKRIIGLILSETTEHQTRYKYCDWKFNMYR